MFGSNVLDVAIGMIFIFLFVSLACSAARELVEAFFKHRARDLESAIVSLIGGDKWSVSSLKSSELTKTGQKSTTSIDTDEFIRRLVSPKSFTDSSSNSSPAASQTADAADFLNKLYSHGLMQGLLDTSAPGYKQHPSYIPSENFAMALIASAKLTLSEEKQLPPNVRTALESFAAEQQGYYEHVKSQVENWYNAAMERAAGRYKRTTQYWLLLFAAVITVSMNVDCIHVAKRLSSDPALRDCLVQAARERVNKSDDAKNVAATGGTGTGGTTSNSTDLDPLTKFESNYHSLDKLGLPIGWSTKSNVPDYIENSDVAPDLSQPALDKKLSWILRNHLVGWLLTILGVSLGAPFWFDALNKFVDVRASLKPTGKSADTQT